jgi:hypothetical protein
LKLAQSPLFKIKLFTYGKTFTPTPLFLFNTRAPLGVTSPVGYERNIDKCPAPRKWSWRRVSVLRDVVGCRV